MTDTDRITVLEGIVAQLLTRVRCLELLSRPAPREGVFYDDDEVVQA